MGRRGYIYGGKVPDNNIYVQRIVFGDDYIESKSSYYNHLGGKKWQNERRGWDGRLVTENIFVIWYIFDYVMSEDDIKKSRNIGGKSPLLICIDCFNSSIKIPTPGGSNNVREGKQQNNITKIKKEYKEAI